MGDTLTLALAQINPTVGDIDANTDRVLRARQTAADGGADLFITGELVLSGYPPEDLVLKEAFQRGIEARVRDLAAVTADGGPALLVGTPWAEEGRLHNSVLLLDGGKIAAVRHKRELPNYGVFDEVRLFTPGPDPTPIPFRGLRLGAMVCEDMWAPGPADALKTNGADILVVLNGSPFELGKPEIRLEFARHRTAATGLPLVYVNLVGGQDELVFDGGSFVLGAGGEIVAAGASWQEQVLLSTWTGGTGGWTCAPQEPPAGPDPLETVYCAVMTGLRDYIDKNHFPGTLIGLSGGIDSALSAAIAVDAVGPRRVHCVMMPSPHTSQDSLDDADEAARLMGTRLDTISIEPAMEAFDTMLREAFVQHPADTTEENIQARSRGLTLMALSNKFGYMVLSTGNKSEMSVGYATLYGDMCGGYNVLKDIYKTTVFDLARWRNSHRPEGALGPEGRVVPERIITKPPSAELKPDQTDQDTLPPYDELDDILECLVEGEMSQKEIAARGHDAEMVAKVWRMVDRAEYKRRQAPPGVKISRRSFGRDRRYPITNGFPG